MARIIIEPQTAKNVKTLIKLAVENQLRIMSFGIAKTRRKLGELEKESGIDSKDFYQEFQKRELGDDLKYIRWAGEYETLARLQKDYDDLQETELCS